MQKHMGTYKGKIDIEGNKVEVKAVAYQDMLEIRSTTSRESYEVPGLREWEGKGTLDYEIAKILVGSGIKTEIGTIIITNCNEHDNEIIFVGTGEPKFLNKVS